MRWLLMVALSFLTLVGGVEACSEVQDGRTLIQRLNDERTVFVGTVTGVSGRAVTFDVQQGIRGEVGRVVSIEALPPSTCSIAFAVGQRWLYAGPSAGGPSVLLMANSAGKGPGDFGRLVRVDDSKVRVPDSWQQCSKSDQCVPAFYGCTGTSVLRERAPDAVRMGREIFGDERAMNCVRRADVAALGALCVANRCGMWDVDYRKSP